MQTAKASRKQSSLSGKESAQGCLPKRLLGRPDYHMMYYAAAAKSLQLCLTLCDPIDGSPAGSPVPGIPQARVLEWVAIAFSNETFS